MWRRKKYKKKKKIHTNKSIKLKNSTKILNSEINLIKIGPKKESISEPHVIYLYK